jgi:hypothetical protein
LENVKGTNNLEDIAVDDRIILGWNLEEGVEYMSKCIWLRTRTGLL